MLILFDHGALGDVMHAVVLVRHGAVLGLVEEVRSEPVQTKVRVWAIPARHGHPGELVGAVVGVVGGDSAAVVAGGVRLGDRDQVAECIGGEGFPLAGGVGRAEWARTRGSGLTTSPVSASSDCANALKTNERRFARHLSKRVST
jgi:hypothetical protein